MELIPCLNCLRIQRENAELRAEVEHLKNLLDEQHRKGKRQAAPFAKGSPKPLPKKPGRKPGENYGTKAYRQPPEQIDEVHEAPLPNQCPDCGGALQETHIDQQYQVEIPRKPIHIGCCQECQRRVQGRHPLQTSDALGAAAAQLGPDAQAAVVEFNKQAGMSHGKISRVFQTLFGIKLTRGGSTHVVLRAAKRCEPVYESIGICSDVQIGPADPMGALAAFDWLGSVPDREKEDPRSERPPGSKRHRRTFDRVIPWLDARQQSQPPFHPARR